MFCWHRIAGLPLWLALTILLVWPLQLTHREPMPESDRSTPSITAVVASAMQQHESALVGYVAGLLGGDVERAREVVQDAFLKLCISDVQRVEQHLKSWLFAVCRNRALDILRKDHRLELGNDLAIAAAPCPQPDPARAALQREWREDLWRWVDELRPNQREVLRLKFLHDCSYRQIAEITGLTVGNVGFIMHHAISALRDRIAGEGSQPE